MKKRILKIVIRLMRHLLIVLPLITIYVITLGFIEIKVSWRDGGKLNLPGWLTIEREG